MKNKYELKVTWIPTYEGAVLNAIKEAKIQNKVIVKIGLPIKIQREIMKNTPIPKGKRLKELFGIKVEQSKQMTITTEFYQFTKV
jgi:hypothetical protein